MKKQHYIAPEAEVISWVPQEFCQQLNIGQSVTDQDGQNRDTHSPTAGDTGKTFDSDDSGHGTSQSKGWNWVGGSAWPNWENR